MTLTQEKGSQVVRAGCGEITGVVQVLAIDRR